MKQLFVLCSLLLIVSPVFSAPCTQDQLNKTAFFLNDKRIEFENTLNQIGNWDNCQFRIYEFVMYDIIDILESVAPANYDGLEWWQFAEKREIDEQIKKEIKKKSQKMQNICITFRDYCNGKPKKALPALFGEDVEVSSYSHNAFECKDVYAGITMNRSECAYLGILDPETLNSIVNPIYYR